MSPVAAVLVVVVMLGCLAAVLDARRMQREAADAARRAREERDDAAALAVTAEAWLTLRLDGSERRRKIATHHARQLRVELRAALSQQPVVVAPPREPEAPAPVPVRAEAPVQSKRRRRPLYAPAAALSLTAREVERSTIGPVVRMCARKPWSPVMAHSDRGVAPACWLVRRGVA